MSIGQPRDRFNLYIQKANRNLRLAEFLAHKGGEYQDWVVVALFYVAVQLADAHHFRHTSTWFTSHFATNAGLNPHTRTRLPHAWPFNVFSSYDKLQDLSRLARYLHSGELVAYDSVGVSPEDLWRRMTYLQTVIDYFLSQHPAAKLARVNIQTPLASRPLPHLHPA